MKLLSLLLGLSLVANAALFLVNRKGGEEEREEAKGARNATAGEVRGTAAAVVKRSGPATGEGKAIATALNGGDVEALRDELRAAGVEEDLIRSMVSARIQKSYEARYKAVQSRSLPEAKQNWWKNEDGWWGGGQNKEQRAALKALQAEEKAEYLRVLGEDPRAEAMRQNPWMERQYGYAAAEKRQALMELESDYNELSHEVQRESKGFQMPEDAAKARFIQEEKRRDLAAILSPEELADYELRQSRTAQNLRWQTSKMDATEAEYRAIFEIKREFDEQFGDHDNFGDLMRANKDPEVQKARGEAEKTMKAQLKQALGTERYKAYTRSQDHDYQQLLSATNRFGLPPETPARIYDLRDEVPQVALRIADNADLTPEQKKEEVKKLVDATRERVTGALGADVATVYFDNNGMHWLRQLEGGTIITYSEDGGQSHRRLDQPTRKPPAAAGAGGAAGTAGAGGAAGAKTK